MPGKRHSRAVKLSAAFLARQAGTEAAAAAFRIDPRTLASWVAAGDVPDDEWTAIRDVLRARGAEMAAKGETRGLVAVLTAAGISDRNVRYGELIARREARREAEQDPVVEKPAWLVAVEGLVDPRASLLGAELRHEIEARADEPDEAEPVATPEERDAAMLAWVESIAAMPEDAVRERLEELEPGWAEYYGWQRPGVVALVDAIDAIDGPAGNGEPAPAVTLVGDGTPEGTRSRLARNVSPGAPEPTPEPEIGKDGTWIEVPGGEPWQWEAWKRYEQ